MSEIEQLRKEINELRERLAVLESRKEFIVQKSIAEYGREMAALKQQAPGVAFAGLRQFSAVQPQWVPESPPTSYGRCGAQ